MTARSARHASLVAAARVLSVVVLLSGVAAASLESTPTSAPVRVAIAAVPATTTTSKHADDTTTSTAAPETTTPTTATVPDPEPSGDPGAKTTTKRIPQTGGSSGPPTVRPPQPVGDLGSSSATADGVTLDLAVTATTDPGGIRVTLSVYADTGRMRDAHVDYGDGTFDPPAPFTGCLNTKSPESSTPYYGSGMGWAHTYPHAGNYHVSASETITHQCPPDGSADRTVATSVDIAVSTGGASGNGPVLPSVILRLDHDASDPNRGIIVPLAEDDDGWISAMTLDWGDGSPLVHIDNPATCTDNNGSSYPWAYFVPGALEHHYTTAGSYTITVSTQSASCDGSDAQPATGTIVYTLG
jgi:hypothetical protein